MLYIKFCNTSSHFDQFNFFEECKRRLHDDTRPNAFTCTKTKLLPKRSKMRDIHFKTTTASAQKQHKHDKSPTAKIMPLCNTTAFELSIPSKTESSCFATRACPPLLNCPRTERDTGQSACPRSTSPWNSDCRRVDSLPRYPACRSKAEYS